jgi:hypothetical protein
MSGLDDVYNNAALWTPNMAPPASFPKSEVAAFQRLIDDVAGTRNGRPINKLVWAPDELRWYPHRMEHPAPGYTLPIFYYGNDAEGNKVAAPRWVLLERLDPEQYAATWEQGRYSVYDGSVWDWRGPCPSERYVELRAHCYHDGHCCPCHGAECKCMGEYEHCWGHYVPPNNTLLDWVKQTIKASMADSEVKPTEDVRHFEAPQAQRDAVSRMRSLSEKQDADVDDFTRQMAEFWARHPVSTSGLKRTPGGLYLLN